MESVIKTRQRGLTFGGILFGAIMLVLLGIMSMKIVPAYMQDAQISNMFKAIVNDQNIQQSSESEIRSSFDKRASIDGIKSIRGSDIIISNENGRLVLSTSYSVKIPLGGNVSLVMEFKPTSEEKG